MPHLLPDIVPTPAVAPAADTNEGRVANRRPSCSLAALAAAASAEHKKQAQEDINKSSVAATTATSAKSNGSDAKRYEKSQVVKKLTTATPVQRKHNSESGNSKKFEQPRHPGVPPSHGYPHQPPPPGYGWGPYPPPPPPPPHMKGAKQSLAKQQSPPIPIPHHYPYYYAYHHSYPNMPPPPPHLLKGKPHSPPRKARQVTPEDVHRLKERKEEEKKDDSGDEEMPSPSTSTSSGAKKDDTMLNKDEYFDEIVKRNLARRKTSDSKQEEKDIKKDDSIPIVSPPSSEAPSSNDNSPVPINGKSSHTVPAPAPPAYPPYHHYYPYPPPPMLPPGANHPGGTGYYPHPRLYCGGSPRSPLQESQQKGGASVAQAAKAIAQAANPPSVTSLILGGVKGLCEKEPKKKKRINEDATSKQIIIPSSPNNIHAKCVPLPPPIPSHFYGDIEKEKDAEIPDFHRIMNHPEYFVKSRSRSSTPVPGMKSIPKTGLHKCVMCAMERPATPETIASAMSKAPDKKNPPPVIPVQNKGLCTACDVVVWVIKSNGKNIKWCKGCKNFRNWAAFGEKGSATKCEKCRNRQRVKYLEQKGELKEKRKSLSLVEDERNGRGESSKKRRVTSSKTEGSLRMAKSEDEALNAAIGLSTLFSANTEI